MIVVDASIVLELLLNTEAAARVAARIRDEQLHSPEILDLEILQVLRRSALREEVSERRAEQAVTGLSLLRIARHRHGPLRRRIWQLRKNLTAYDAAYVSLSEVLRAPLLTRDGKLTRSSGHEADIELIS